MSRGRSEIAFILSLIGGIIIILGSAVTALFMLEMVSLGGATGGVWGTMHGMTGYYEGMMGRFGIPFAFMGGLLLAGIVSGIMVVVGAAMLRSRPTGQFTWGLVIVVFSIVSLVGTGGFLVGAILGVIGGAFAMAWRPSKQ